VEENAPPLLSFQLRIDGDSETLIFRLNDRDDCRVRSFGGGATRPDLFNLPVVDRRKGWQESSEVGPDPGMGIWPVLAKIQQLLPPLIRYFRRCDWRRRGEPNGRSWQSSVDHPDALLP
jgi:hypothetical protein